MSPSTGQLVVTNDGMNPLDSIAIRGTAQNLNRVRIAPISDGGASLQIFPQVASDQVFVTMSADEKLFGELYELDVVDMLGRVVKIAAHGNIGDENISSQVIDVRRLAPGMYGVRFVIEGSVAGVGMVVVAR